MVKLRRRHVLAAGLAIVVCLFLLVGVYHERRTFVCQECFSLQDVWQWRCGVWPGPSLPLTPKRAVTEPSSVCKDFFENDHVHRWAFAQGSPYHCFGAVCGGCAIGTGRYRSDFVWQYEGDEEFRDFIAETAPERGITRVQFAKIAALPDTLDPGGTESPEDQELARVRQTLMQDYFAAALRLSENAARTGLGVPGN